MAETFVRSSPEISTCKVDPRLCRETLFRKSSKSGLQPRLCNFFAWGRSMLKPRRWKRVRFRVSGTGRPGSAVVANFRISSSNSGGASRFRCSFKHTALDWKPEMSPLCRCHLLQHLSVQAGAGGPPQTIVIRHNHTHSWRQASSPGNNQRVPPSKLAENPRLDRGLSQKFRGWRPVIGRGSPYIIGGPVQGRFRPASCCKTPRQSNRLTGA